MTIKLAVIKVENYCQQCPYFIQEVINGSYYEPYCQHQKWPNRRAITPPIESNHPMYGEPQEIPGWCPLDDYIDSTKEMLKETIIPFLILPTGNLKSSGE